MFLLYKLSPVQLRKHVKGEFKATTFCLLFKVVLWGGAGRQDSRTAGLNVSKFNL